jgi:hypothetical protein
MNSEGDLAIGVGYLFNEGTIHFSPSPSFVIHQPSSDHKAGLSSIPLWEDRL